MAVYFTSDLHLGHRAAINFTERPFVSVEEMNEKLLENINNIVMPNDTLWILGDVSFRISREESVELLKKIRCKTINLVRGNHDRDYSECNIFNEVCDYKELTIKGNRFVLFHYPIMDWNARHHGSIHLHGHIHSNGDYNLRNLSSGEEYRIWDVGVDANDYKPISSDELLDLFNINTAQ